jgi:plasmid stability protein
MATLYVRDMPEDLYERLREQARDSRRSIGAAAIDILQRDLGAGKSLSFEEMLGRSRAVRKRSRAPSGGKTVAEEIRDDRER